MRHPKKSNSSVLLHSRLSPDMFALIRQVQIATEQAKNGSARPASVEAPPYEDNETTMDELKTPIARTVAYPRFQRWRMIGSTLLPLPDVWPSCVNSRLNFSRPDTGAYADQLSQNQIGAVIPCAAYGFAALASRRRNLPPLSHRIKRRDGMVGSQKCRSSIPVWDSPMRSNACDIRSLGFDICIRSFDRSRRRTRGRSGCRRVRALFSAF